MKHLVELVANKPWILIIFGFFLLISVWVVFFALAAQNQPVRLIGTLPVISEIGAAGS